MNKYDTILAIETSTSACSVAVQNNKGELVHRKEVGNNVHSRVLLPMIEEVLKSASLKLTDLDAIGVSKGPGSFTGLRIGIGVAQGLAYGAQKPMFGFTSLEILVAQQEKVDSRAPVLAALDARMNEIYWGVYQYESGDGSSAKLARGTQIQVSVPSSIKLEGFEFDQLRALGNAWVEYPEFAAKLTMSQVTLPNKEDSKQLLPDAIGLVRLYGQELNNSPANLNKQLLAPADFRPLYVRNNVAAKPKFKQVGLKP